MSQNIMKVVVANAINHLISENGFPKETITPGLTLFVVVAVFIEISKLS